MTERFLDKAQVAPVLVHVCSQTMAKGMSGNLFVLQSEFRRMVTDDFGQRSLGDMGIRFSTGEQPVTGSSALIPVFSEDVEDKIRHVHAFGAPVL